VLSLFRYGNPMAESGGEMAAHGDRFWHLEMLTENGNIEKGKEKNNGSSAK